MDNASFLASRSDVRPDGKNDIVTIEFDAPTSKSIMEWFAAARKSAQGFIKMQVQPMHKPDRLVVKIVKKRRKQSAEGIPLSFGYAVDQVGPDGLVLGSLPTAVPYDPVKPPDDDMSLGQKDPIDVTFDADGDQDGNVVLKMQLTFARSEING